MQAVYGLISQICCA